MKNFIVFEVLILSLILAAMWFVDRDRKNEPVVTPISVQLQPDSLPNLEEYVEEKVTATLYQPVKGQCDSNPLVTADGSRIDLEKLCRGELRWIALSQDLIKTKDWNYGDTIKVESDDENLNGDYVIHDTMNKRCKKRIDILISPDIKNFGRGVWRNVTIKTIKKGV